MGNRVKVVINRRNWGRNIMAGPAIAAFVEGVGQQIADKLDDGHVELVESSVMQGGARVRARVSHGTSSTQEADSNELIKAASSVVRLQGQR
jgi:hypothetical protein